jgi:ComF family protein
MANLLNIKNLKQICLAILDFLFPSKPSVAILEALSAEELANRVGPPEPLPRKLFWVSACFNYRDPLVRQAIWELKYRGNRRIAKLLGNALYAELSGAHFEEALFETKGRPVIIPVPLSAKRRRERGFNQTELLIAELREADQEGLFDYDSEIVIKHKHSKSQTETLTRRARQANITGCFSVNSPNRISGRDVILIDDVVTTGATLSEIKKVLLAEGATTVRGTVVAH